MDNLFVYIDGACSGNPGRGGWGALILSPGAGVSREQVRELGGEAERTTNNRMELTAAIEAFKKLPDRAPSVRVVTDSTYVMKGITEWIHGWRKRGWKTAEGTEVQNRDLWEALAGLTTGLGARTRFEWVHVRGHQGVPGNERADQIATAYAQGRPVSLYSGPLQGYSLTLEALTELSPRIAAASRAGRDEGFPRYLSLVDGKLATHATWGECEARTKGVSGARFKKVESAFDEAETKKKWGVLH